MERIYGIACYFCWYRGTIARIVITKIHTRKHIPETFFLLSSQQARVQNKSFKITEGYIMRIIQNIKVKSNYSGVLYREELRLYPLRSKRDFPPYSCINWFRVIFNRSYFCSVSLFSFSYPFVIFICFFIISFIVEVNVLGT